MKPIDEIKEKIRTILYRNNKEDAVSLIFSCETPAHRIAIVKKGIESDIKKIFETYSLELDDSGQDLIENDGFYYEYARRISNAGFVQEEK